MITPLIVTKHRCSPNARWETRRWGGRVSGRQLTFQRLDETTKGEITRAKGETVGGSIGDSFWKVGTQNPDDLGKRTPPQENSTEEVRRGKMERFVKKKEPNPEILEQDFPKQGNVDLKKHNGVDKKTQKSIQEGREKGKKRRLTRLDKT